MLFKYDGNNFNEVNNGDILTCILKGQENLDRFSIGNRYKVVNVDINNLAVIDDTGEPRWLERGDVFKMYAKKHKHGIEAYTHAVCVDASGTTALKHGQIYVVTYVGVNFVKISGSDIKWKLSRFQKLEWKAGYKVKLIKKLAYPRDWYPVVGQEYIVKSANDNKIGIELKGAPEEYNNGTQPVWNKNNFEIISTDIAPEKVKVKKKKTIKLDTKKMHTHNCVNCEKQIFPKTMCKCEVQIDLPT
jgi:hypothetical protein